MSIRFSAPVLRSALFLTAAAILQPIHAQTPRPPIRSVIHYTVKSERAGDLSAAIKEYNEVLKKASWDKNYTIWRSSTGPMELLLVSYHDKWADLDASTSKDPKLKDHEADLTRIVHRINESFSSSRRVIDSIDREASTPMSTEMPKMLRVWTAHVKEGKMKEAVDLERKEYAPAVKSAGLKSYSFAIARYGAPANEIRASVGLDSWAELDTPNPIRKAMGDEKYAAFTDKMGALLEDYHYDVYRFDPELSYIAAK
jgi:hypothetical protein